jgi:hypothetical protein
MRPVRHLTPRYLINRIKLMRYQKQYPTLPWLTIHANAFLSNYLQPKSDHGLEWGSGRSTVWFAKHLQSLISVEHDDLWYQQINSRLQSKSCKNVDYRFRPVVDVEHPTADEISAYAGVADELPNDSLDFVLVDGIMRDQCAIRAISKLRPGGLLVIDNVNWYLPCISATRPADGEASSPTWNAFREATSTWRRYWTSDGVTDTALFFKPH